MKQRDRQFILEGLAETIPTPDEIAEAEYARKLDEEIMADLRAIELDEENREREVAWVDDDPRDLFDEEPIDYGYDYDPYEWNPHHDDLFDD